MKHAAPTASREKTGVASTSPRLGVQSAATFGGAARGVPAFLQRALYGAESSAASSRSPMALEEDAEAVADKVDSHPGGGGVLERTAAITGADLSRIRVHANSPLPRVLGAQAFARGSEIFAGPGTTDHVLAHEAAHTVQQTHAGAPAVLCFPDPTATTLTDEVVDPWSAADLNAALELLLDHLVPENKCAPELPVGAGEENLRILLRAASRKSIEVRDDLLRRIPSVYGPHGEEVTLLFSRLDLVLAMLGKDFPEPAVKLQQRVESHRNLYPWLDSMGIRQARLDLDENVVAIETAAKIKRAAIDPGGDAELSAAIGTVHLAIANLLGGLLTPRLAGLVTEVSEARDAWLKEIGGAFRRATVGAQEKVATAIDPNGYGKFSRGLPPPVQMQPARHIIAVLEEIRALVHNRLGKLAESIPATNKPLEEQINFVITKSDHLNELLALAEKVMLGTVLCEQGKTLADATWDEYQINQENFEALQDVGNTLLFLVQVDTPAAQMPGLRAKVERAVKHSDARIESIQEYRTRVNWFINIAATLLGMGAMRAVMSLTAVKALGQGGAYLVGSLAFTTTRLVLTNNQGRPLTAGGFLEDAAKDYLLMRVLMGVDARIVARVGEAGMVAAAVRLGGVYGTLVGWTLVWNALQPGAHGPTGATTTTTGDVMLQTAVDLAVLTIAEAMLRAPVIPGESALVKGGRNPAAYREAQRHWEALRAELEATGKQLREWLKGKREDVRVGEELLSKASILFGRTKGVHARFAELGEITDVQRAALDKNADAMQESIRNAGDELGLGVRNVSAETWSYRGSNENIGAYLQRLVTQGRYKQVQPEGNGVFSVVGNDGTLQWFFPEGRTSPVVLDVVGDSLTAAAPDVGAPVRNQALVHLRSAGWSELGSFAGGLAPGKGAALVQWIARPDTGAALGTRQLPMPVVRELAASPAAKFEPIAGSDATSLPSWHKAWQARNPSGTPAEFITFLNQMLAWRGTLAISGPPAATAVIGRFAEAQTPVTLRFDRPATREIGPTGGLQRIYDQPLVEALRGKAIPEATYNMTTYLSVRYVIEIVGGRVTRMFEIRGDPSVMHEIPVATSLRAIRETLKRIAGRPNDPAARAELALVEPLGRQLDALLAFKESVPADQIRPLAELADHPLRNTPTAGPPSSTTLAAQVAKAEAATRAQEVVVEQARETLRSRKAAEVEAKNRRELADDQLAEAKEYETNFGKDPDPATRDHVRDMLRKARDQVKQAKDLAKQARDRVTEQTAAVAEAEVSLHKARDAEVAAARQKLEADLADLYVTRRSAWSEKQAEVAEAKRLSAERARAERELREAEALENARPEFKSAGLPKDQVAKAYEQKAANLKPKQDAVARLKAEENAAAQRQKLAEKQHAEADATINRRVSEFELKQVAAAGITPARYAELRARTPNSARQADAQKQTTDAIYGTKIEGTPQADHIVSMFEIVRMRGFNKLSPKLQEEILNDPKNFWALDASVNASKGNRSLREWRGHSDAVRFEKIPDAKFDELVVKEEKARDYLKKRIEALTGEKPAADGP